MCNIHSRHFFQFCVAPKTCLHIDMDEVHDDTEKPSPNSAIHITLTLTYIPVYIPYFPHKTLLSRYIRERHVKKYCKEIESKPYNRQNRQDDAKRGNLFMQ
jgi:hypothetical protein